MVGCQQAATDHGGLAVKSRDASVMKNPGSPVVVSGQRNLVGSRSRVASARKRWARQPCLCFQLLTHRDDDDRYARRVHARGVSWRNSNSGNP